MANSAKINVPVTGLESLREVLRLLPVEVRDTVLVSMVDSACKPIEAAAKGFAQKRSGALAKSITHVVRKYRNRAVVVGVIGPDKKYYSAGKRLRKDASKSGADKPANYAHLVEFGHVNRDGSFTPAQPFLRPAALAGAGAAADAMASGAEKGIEKARRKFLINSKSGKS